MNSQEANKIIAEFMEWELFKETVSDGIFHRPLFTLSLDALVPVWEKIGKYPNMTKWSGLYSCEFQISIGKGFKYKIVECCNHKGTIQEAAAIATAKAIKEKNND